MIVKELVNLKAFPIFLNHLKVNDIDAKEFIKRDELDQIGHYIQFIDEQGISFMCTNYSVLFAYNKNSKFNTLNEDTWKTIDRYSLKFDYKDSIETIKIAIIKSFEIITPF